MATVDYVLEEGARRSGVRWGVRVGRQLADRLFARIPPVAVWDDEFRSDVLGVDGDGVPFIDTDGGVGTHGVRVINGSVFLFEGGF